MIRSLLAVVCVFVVLPSPGVGQQRKPNVLIMIADDQGWADLGCVGIKDDVATPNIDALAKTGVRFTQAYATSPICNASRAGLITGSYQQRFGTFWYGGRGIHDPKFITLPEMLGAAGFACGYSGKFHYGGGKAARPGDRSFPVEHGFTSFLGFAGGRKHYLNHSAAKERAFQQVKNQHGRKGQSLRQGPLWRERKTVDVDGYSTDIFGAEARRYIDQHADEPFYLHLAFNAVHNFTHQLPKGELERRGLKGWHDWDPATEDYYEWYRKGRRQLDGSGHPEGRAWYLAQLELLDREVGRVLAHLDAKGLRDDTIIVYVGDNGGSTPIWADNGPLRGSKYTLYEGGIRVPLIISYPKGFKGGRLIDNVVSAMDLLPTIASLTGVKAPDHVDGMNLTPLLSGAQPKLGHDVLVWDTGHETAVRKGRWKLKTARNRRHADYEMVELELGTFLYDLVADPGEKTDLSKKHPERVAELSRIHTEWRAGLAR